MPPAKDVNAPTYANIEAPPSLLPRQKYSDITGMVAHYADPRSKLHYASKDEYELIRQMTPAQVHQYLEVRKANVVIK